MCEYVCIRAKKLFLRFWNGSKGDSVIFDNLHAQLFYLLISYDVVLNM